MLRIHSHWEAIPMNNVCPTWFAMGFRRWSSRPHVTPNSDFPKKPHVSFLPPKNVVKSWNVSEIEMGQREWQTYWQWPTSPTLTSQLCKWKSKLEMSSPLVPKTIHRAKAAAANFVETLSLLLPFFCVEQQIYGLGGQSILHYILSSSQVRKSFTSMVI